ncbi:MAG: hypothetical protein IPM51_03705 [Sphingobacteriaceae bacterium]|nr:hypothetical protein [Sphingobacteriaceae bacterium]
MTTTLNYRIPIKIFKNSIDGYSDSVLKAKLSGRIIKLTIEKIPNKIKFTHNARFIHLIFINSGYKWNHDYSKILDMDIKASYKVLDGDIITNEGVIFIPDNNDKPNRGFNNTWKHGLDGCISQYDLYIERTSRLIIDKIISDL